MVCGTEAARLARQCKERQNEFIDEYTIIKTELFDLHLKYYTIKHESKSETLHGKLHARIV